MEWGTAGDFKTHGLSIPLRADAMAGALTPAPPGCRTAARAKRTEHTIGTARAAWREHRIRPSQPRCWVSAINLETSLNHASLLDALSSGRAKGYSERTRLDGVEILNEYAVKRVGEKFLVYTFSIELSKIDAADDYGDFEERREFEDFDDALAFLRAAGADIEKFGVFKGISPI